MRVARGAAAMCVGASRRRVTGVTASCVCNEGCVGAAVMWFGRRRAVRARALQGHAGRLLGRPRASLRCKPSVGTADCIAGGCKGCIRAAEQRFCNRFQQRAVWTTQWCCTRARGGRGLRDAELHRLTNERLGCQQVDALGTGSKSLVFGGIHPKQNWYWSRRRHTSNRTRGTRSRLAAARTERFAVQPQRTHATRVTPSDRGYIIRREPRGCCPGHTVIIPRRGLPNTAHQKRPLRTPPPRPW